MREDKGGCKSWALAAPHAIRVLRSPLPLAYCRVFPELEEVRGAGSGRPSCTLRRLCTALTPLTCWAICTARWASAALATAPV